MSTTDTVDTVPMPKDIANKFKVGQRAASCLYSFGIYLLFVFIYSEHICAKNVHEVNLAESLPNTISLISIACVRSE